MDYSSNILRKHYDTENKMHRSSGFSFVCADTKTEQRGASEEFVGYGSEMAEGTKSEQMGAGWSLATPEESRRMGSPAALHGCGLPAEDAGKSLVPTVVFS